jgi:hypothetical protein
MKGEAPGSKRSPGVVEREGSDVKSRICCTGSSLEFELESELELCGAAFPIATVIAGENAGNLITEAPAGICVIPMAIIVAAATERRFFI